MNRVLFILIACICAVAAFAQIVVKPGGGAKAQYAPGTGGQAFAYSQSNAATFTGTFFVSAAGSDANNGFTTGTPFATVSKAQTAVRALLATQATNIAVTVMNQVPVSSPLALTSADSPKNGFSVTWKGAGSLFAGTYITNWTASSNAKIYQASYSGPSVRSLYFNGDRRYRSRANGSIVGGLTETAAGYTGATGTFLATEHNSTNVEFIYQVFNFSEARNIVTNITGNTVNLLQAAHTTINGWSPTLIDIENLYGSFTNNLTGGTFYQDTANLLIYYIPRPNETMVGAVVWVPNGTVESIVTGSGVTNVNFTGLTFKGAAWDIHKFGFASIAQAYYQGANGDTEDVVPAAVYLNGCTNCSLFGCVISNCDTTGFHRTFACQGCHAVSNFVQDIAFNGMALGEHSESTNAALRFSTNCNTINNYIDQVGQLASGAVGMCQPYITSGHFDFNTVEETPYCGIANGVGLDGETNFVAHIGGNTINSNYFIDTMLKQLDGGAIYSQNCTSFGGSGMQVLGNNISRTRRYGSIAAAGIYLDQGSQGVVLASNLIQGCNYAMFFNMHSNEQNVVLANYTDGATVTFNGTSISTNTAPTVTTVPAWSQPGIAASAGAVGMFTAPTISWDTYVTSLGPVLWYKHNDTTTTLVDSSGNGLNATLSGTYTQSAAAIAPGISRNTTTYNGSSGQATLSTTTKVNFGGTSPFSVVTLIKPNLPRPATGFNLDELNWIKNTDAAGAGWDFYFLETGNAIPPFTSSLFSFEIVNNGNANRISYVGGTDVTNAAPFLLVSTYNGNGKLSGTSLYINGYYEPNILPTDALSGSAASTSPFHVASNNGSSSFYGGGMGDDIIIPYALTPNEVHNLAYAAQVSFK